MNNSKNPNIKREDYCENNLKAKQRGAWLLADVKTGLKYDCGGC